MIQDQIKSITHSLRLFGIHQNFEARANEALSQNLPPLDFLRLLLEDEQLARRDRVSKALTTKAKFRWEADLEDWDQSYDRGISKAQLKELFSFSFLLNKQSLLIVGKTGEGKTQLAIALGRRLCHQNHSTLFIPVNFLFEEVQAERSAGRYLAYIKKLTKAQVLILDDFGLRNYTHEEATILMDLLEERYQKGSVLVTSQTEPRGWEKLFEDPIIAEAIVDRLTSPSQKITLKGGSYRERLQLKLKKNLDPLS